MPSKRKSGTAVGRVGNYAAPVDTAGMDPEMKRTLGIAGGGRARRDTTKTVTREKRVAVDPSTKPDLKRKIEQAKATNARLQSNKRMREFDRKYGKP